MKSWACPLDQGGRLRQADAPWRSATSTTARQRGVCRGGGAAAVPHHLLDRPSRGAGPVPHRDQSPRPAAYARLPTFRARHGADNEALSPSIWSFWGRFTREWRVARAQTGVERRSPRPQRAPSDREDRTGLSGAAGSHLISPPLPATCGCRRPLPPLRRGAALTHRAVWRSGGPSKAMSGNTGEGGGWNRRTCHHWPLWSLPRPQVR